MGVEDVTVDVTYHINSYALTINYWYDDGTEAAPTHTDSIQYNAPYSVVSPEIIGYTPDIDTVAGTMGVEDVTVDVTYHLNSYEIDALADPEEGGTVSGTGPHNHFEDIALVASPNTGYHFVNWTEDGAVVGTSDTLAFVVTGPRELVAHFALNSYEIGASASPASYGSVSGAGTYNHFDECTLVATPTEGHVFLRWARNGATASMLSTFTFTVTESADYVAQFRIKGYDVNATVNPVEGGTVSGTGDYSYGTTATLTANPNPGYAFLNWTQGGQVVSSEASFSFTVTQDTAFVANFEALPRYTIAVLQAEGGTLHAPDEAYEGQTVAVTAEYESLYRLVSLYYYTDDPEDTTPIDLQTMQFAMPASDINLTGVFQLFEMGDVNLDGEVNIIDVLAVLNYILGYDPQPFDFELADMNGDGAIDISDAFAINAVILDFGDRDGCGDLAAVYSVIDGVLFIDANLALAGFQFTLDAEPASVELQGFTARGNWVDGKYVLLAFNLNGEHEPGLYPVLTLGQADIDAVTMATLSGCRVRGEEGTVGLAENGPSPCNVYPVPARDELTVEADGIEAVEVFDLLGQRLLHLGNVHADRTTVNVSALAAGCYLFRIHTGQGTLVRKVTVVK